MKLENLTGSLRTFEMSLEEKKNDKKSKGITFQVKSHAEETKSFCDDDDDLVQSVVKIINRLNRSNINGPRSRNSGNILTGITTLRRNSSTNVGLRKKV